MDYDEMADGVTAVVVIAILVSEGPCAVRYKQYSMQWVIAVGSSEMTDITRSCERDTETRCVLQTQAVAVCDVCRA
jgi:hypothetical protein